MPFRRGASYDGDSEIACGAEERRLIRLALADGRCHDVRMLLGVSGYDDAFNSLAIFLEQLEGYGRLIASARSVYYEEEFLGRASRASTVGLQAWFHVPVKIEPWQSEDQASFLDELAIQESLPDDEQAALRGRVSEVFRGNDALASKPLFFAKAVDLLRKDPDFSGGDDLLGTLTHRFLEREQREKLLDRNQQPLLSERRLELLMGELAEEMWNQETRELDRGSVREVAEYVLDDGDMPESARKIVIERMPTLAFLASSETHASVLFEHEVFFFHFLARALVNQYVRDMDMRVVLSRSPLPEFVAERLAFELRQIDRLSSLDGLQEILDRLSETGRLEWRRTMQVRENVGLIVLALLREFAFADSNGSNPEISGCTISTVIFPGSNLYDVTLRNCTLVNVEIRRTDLGATKFIDCNARDVLLVLPVFPPRNHEGREQGQPPRTANRTLLGRSRRHGYLSASGRVEPGVLVHPRLPRPSTGSSPCEGVAP